MKIRNRLLITFGAIYVVASIIIVVVVNYNMRKQALFEAESKSLMLLNHNLAIHTYFSHELKPKLFIWSEPLRSPDYFEPTWMSSTFAVRKMDHYFKSLGKSKYYYKESAINARCPENEADPYEKAFLEELYNDPKLVNRSAVRTLNGQTFFVTMRRGERMEESCLRCHSTPDRAPGNLVKLYGSTRSFGRRVGEEVQAISIRIPLDEAYGQANRLSWQLSGILLGLLGFLFASQTWISKGWLFDPLATLRQKAQDIADSEVRLGETIPVPAGPELRDLAMAFNAMSRNLRQSYDTLEERIHQRTAELNHLNEQLEQDITRRELAEEALRESEQRLRAVLDATPFPIAVVDLLDDNIHFWSHSASTIFGHTAPTASEWYQVAYPDPNYRREVINRWKPSLEIARESRQTVNTGEYRVTCSDGSVRICELYATFLPDMLIVTFNDITERKRAEELVSINYNALKETTQWLEQSRNMLQLIIESVPVRVFWKDRELRYLGCNTLFARDAGLSQPEQLLGKDDFAMGWGEQAEAYRADDRQVIESRRTKMNIVEPQTTPTGAKIWLSTSKVPLQMPNGEVFGVLGVYDDVTARYQAELALKKERDQAQQYLDIAAVMIIILDSQGRITLINKKGCEILGYREEDALNLDWFDIFIPEKNRDCLKAKFADLLAGKIEPWEYVESLVLTKRGEERLITWHNTVLNDDSGAIIATLSSGKDITERRLAEEAFQSLVRSAPMGIYIVQDGKFAMVNPGFEVITGYHAQELIGQHCLNPVSAEFRAFVREQALLRLKEEGLPPYEYQFITKNGETGWVMETVTRTQYQGKQAVMGYFMDISLLKELQEQFLQVQKMEAVGTLAGGIAHDFNNILMVIIGNIGLAKLDNQIVPRVKDRLAQAEAACWRAQALSQQLLTFAKGGAPVKKLFSVAELLTESTTFTCVGSAVKCETTFPENLWSIEADPGQISQVFQNLTINAIQAMPNGGTIKVWAENLTLEIESGLPLSAGKYISISVQDKGMGIPAEHLPRIFDPYFTTKQKGSGLGLASTYAIVNKHHGHIAVESKPGVGTTFTVYLPAVEQQATPQPKEDRGLLVGTGKILVMDDEEMVREVLGRLLASLGYEAEFARDGGEAIEMFVQAQESGPTFAGVILDLTIPGGMGGKETMAKLLYIDPQVKAIVSSGYSDDPIMADFKKYGFSGVIAKPYRISELGKILNQMILKKA